MINRGEEAVDWLEIVVLGEYEFFFISLKPVITTSFDGVTLVATILGKTKGALFFLLTLEITVLFFS